MQKLLIKNDEKKKKRKSGQVSKISKTMGTQMSTKKEER
jgi:hypothetical protein